MKEFKEKFGIDGKVLYVSEDGDNQIEVEME